MKQLHPRAVWLFFINLVGLSAIGIIIAFFILLFLIADSFLRSDAGALTSSGLLYLTGLISILVILYIWAKLTYRYYRYEFTETAFKKEHGVIWKKYVSIPYDRVQNVDIYRGIIARLLGLSDLQIQTAGGITAGSYGAFAEGRLPGLTKEEAEKLREELIHRVQRAKSQGL